MSSPVARALRDNHVVEVDSKDLVPGDIVLLEAGDVVPADMRLLEANSLKIEEAALTGESVPVDKDLSAVLAEDAPIGDRVNMAYQNSNVTYGVVLVWLQIQVCTQRLGTSLACLLMLMRLIHH